MVNNCYLMSNNVLFLQLVIVLKKEVIKTNNVTEHEDTDKYRQLLVRTLHSCSVRFPDMAANVIPVVWLLSEHSKLFLCISAISKYSLLATKLKLHTSPDHWIIEHLQLIHLALFDVLMINKITVLIFALKCTICVATVDGVPEWH